MWGGLFVWPLFAAPLLMMLLPPLPTQRDHIGIGAKIRLRLITLPFPGEELRPAVAVVVAAVGLIPAAAAPSATAAPSDNLTPAREVPKSGVELGAEQPGQRFVVPFFGP